MLFDWSDIVDTAHALEQALSQSFTYVQGVITNQVEPLVNGFFSKLESTVSSAFDTAIAQFDSGQTMSSLTSSSSSNPHAAVGIAPRRRSVALLAPSGSASTIQSWQGNVQNSWLLEKIESFLGQAPTLEPVHDLVQPLETLKTAFDSVDRFPARLRRLQQISNRLLAHTSEFATLAVADFLDAVKEVALAVLTFLDGIIEALLQVLAAALGAADQLLTAPLDLPFFTALWDGIGDAFNVTMPSVSVAGVFCTAPAVPVTALYKLINGVETEPFPGGVLPTGGDQAQLAASSTTAETACQYTAVGIAALWALMDTGLYAVPDVDLMVF